MNKDLIAIFEYLEKEKGVKRSTVISAIEEALEMAAKKSFQNLTLVSVSIDPKTGEITVQAEKEVVDTVEYPGEEISWEDAQEIDEDCSIGDFIKIPVPPVDLGRIAAQKARHIIAEKLKNAERDIISEEYRHRIHEIISGTVKKVINEATLIVDLGRVEAILPRRFYPKTEQYHEGDRVQALIWEVSNNDKGGADILLSRTHPEFIEQLFRQEVPEIHEETVVINRIVREPGYRTKILVSSNDQRIDPLGACVGVRGTRVKNIIRELNNEKIDIIIDETDPNALLTQLLAPVEPKHVFINEEEQTIYLVVADEDYPVIIGRKGLNARLIGRLMDQHLVVKKMSEYQNELLEERETIQSEQNSNLDLPIEKIGNTNQLILDSLKDAGLDTPRKIFKLSAKELAKETGISNEMAENVIEQLRKMRSN